MKTPKTVIGPESSELFKEVAEILKYSDIEAICTDGGINEILELAETKHPKFVFYEAERENADALSYMSHELPNEPLLMFIAKKETDISNIWQGENSRVLRLPANPENVAMLLRFCLRDITALSEAEQARLLESHISHVLVSGNISPDVRGFYYLLDTLTLFLKNRYRPLGDVYREIGERRGATVAGIDHGVRAAIKRCWETSSNFFKMKYFTFGRARREQIPRPKEFILTVVAGINRELTIDRFHID